MKYFECQNSQLVEKKAYTVFLSEIMVLDIKGNAAAPFVSLGTYIEDFVVGDEYLYATLSMKE